MQFSLKRFVAAGAGLVFSAAPVPLAVGAPHHRASSAVRHHRRHHRVHVETVGSSSHSTDSQFCATHRCVANFRHGNGYIIQCIDEQYSHSGGRSSSCSGHGGNS